jgi:hypothetical protein
MTLSPPLYEEQTQGKEQYTALECGCSWCQRNGEIAVHPLVENVKFTHGLEHRGEYFLASKRAAHWFCKICASTLGADTERVMRDMGVVRPRLNVNVSASALVGVR